MERAARSNSEHLPSSAMASWDERRMSPGALDGLTHLAQRGFTGNELDSPVPDARHPAAHLGELPRLDFRVCGRVDAFHEMLRQKQSSVIRKSKRIFKNPFNSCCHGGSGFTLAT